MHLTFETNTLLGKVYMDFSHVLQRLPVTTATLRMTLEPVYLIKTRPQRFCGVSILYEKCNNIFILQYLSFDINLFWKLQLKDFLIP